MKSMNKPQLNITLVIILIFVGLVIAMISLAYILTLDRIAKSGIGDTFTGTALSIIGILTTFIIGYQIYNAVDLKRDIEEKNQKAEMIISKFKESINEKIAVVEKLKEELTVLKCENNKSLLDIKIQLSLSRYKYYLSINNEEQALFNILECITDRIELEKYIGEYKVEECGNSVIVDVAKIVAYEFIFIDLIIKIFEHYTTSESDETIIFNKNRATRSLFELLEIYSKNNKSEVYMKTYNILSNKAESESSYSFDRKSFNKLSEYKDCLFKINKTDIAFLVEL